MKTRLEIGGRVVKAGEACDVAIKISEYSTGEPALLPVRVVRAKKRGPVVFVSAAVHGDEINGTGIIRELMFGDVPALERGTLVCVPVVNVFGFERHERYMPDRRDLNRSFPGSASGSLASRFAATLMREVVRKCDFGIDLHTAAAYRTNYPNVRGDLRDPKVKPLAMAFGCELVVHGKGPDGSLRREACRAGVPTVILEAGEIAKIEPTVLEVGVQGVLNVLRSLEMISGEPVRPVYQTEVHRTTWLRAELGGLLRFHVAPGDLVEAGQPIATNSSVFGEAKLVLIAPCEGIVLGMVTHPGVQPGEPVVHLARPRTRIRSIRRALSQSSGHRLAQRLRTELATNVSVDAADPDRRTGGR